MRDGQTEEFSRIPMDIGEAFAGVLLNCLRFVEPAPSDSNKSRWQMVDYWANLVGDVGRIKIFTLPDSDYNLEKCRRFTTGDFVSTGTYNPPTPMIAIKFWLCRTFSLQIPLCPTLYSRHRFPHRRCLSL